MTCTFGAEVVKKVTRSFISQSLIVFAVAVTLILSKGQYNSDV
jgi:hypothetical protein